MLPEFAEHCNARGTLNKYFQNITCWLGLALMILLKSKLSIIHSKNDALSTGLSNTYKNTQKLFHIQPAPKSKIIKTLMETRSASTHLITSLNAFK